MPGFFEISDDVTDCIKRVLEDDDIDFDLDLIPGKAPPEGWEANPANWKAYVDLIIECITQKESYEGFSVGNGFPEATRFEKLSETRNELTTLIDTFLGSQNG